jgi:tetratricopeptide (TPR) repeat protein
MNDDRHQVYLSFVNALLACDESEVELRLQERVDLWDAGLLQTLSEVAEFLTWGGDEKATLRLRNIAERIVSHLETADSAATVCLPSPSKQEGDRLVKQGAQQYQASQFREALKSWQQALAIYQAIGDSVGEARVLSNMGVALKSLGEYQQAIEHYQQSVAIRREGGDIARLAPKSAASADDRALLVEHHVQGEFHQAMQLAIEHFQKQLKLAQSIGDRLVEAKSLHNLGKAYGELGQTALAIEYHQHSLTIKRLIGDRVGELESLALLGKACETLNQPVEAIAYYRQHLDLAQAQNHREALPIALTGWGNAAFILGDYQQTARCYQRGLAIAREKEDFGEVSAYLSGLGNAYHALADYKQAVEYYHQSLTIKQEIGDRFGEAVVLENISKAYSALKDYHKAMQYHQKALAIKREMGYE